MGQQKLLMPAGSRCVIQHVLASLEPIPAAQRYVVIRSDDKRLASIVAATSAQVLQPPTNPPDMRASVEVALREIAKQHSPKDTDGWMLLPADSVGLTPDNVCQLLHVWNNSDADILVPQIGKRRGHPAFFRWPLAERLFHLDSSVGVNALRTLEGVAVELHTVTDPGVLEDLDTPDDYNAMLKNMQRRDVENQR